MREETTDLIYAIKKNEQHREKLKEIVIDFYSEYSDTPRSEYTDSIVFNLVKTAFLLNSLVMVKMLHIRFVWV